MTERLAAIKEDLAPEELDWVEQHYKGVKESVLWLIQQVEAFQEDCWRHNDFVGADLCRNCGATKPGHFITAFGPCWVGLLLRGERVPT